MLLFVRLSPISETITKLDFEKNKNTCILYLHIKKLLGKRIPKRENTYVLIYVLGNELVLFDSCGHVVIIEVTLLLMVYRFSSPDT